MTMLSVAKLNECQHVLIAMAYRILTTNGACNPDVCRTMLEHLCLNSLVMQPRSSLKTESEAAEGHL